jgi:hypothetical protein
MLSASPLKVDLEKVPENLQRELINLHRDSNLKQMLSKTKKGKIVSYPPKEKRILWQYLFG